MSEIKRPLEGVKVIELATFIAGPCCARYLADLGADVIKVEAPSGDPLRYTAVNEGRPYGDAEDTSFSLENTGKKCVTLNTKTEVGRKVLEELIAESDIFITNWRQPALKRAELDYESLKQKYPKLVMGYVSGYGEKGPDKDLPGFDFTAYFARGGIMGTMYDVDSAPMLPVAGFGDHQVGIYLASGVLAALYRARETGQGDQVTVSLFHTAIWDISLYLQCNQYGDSSTQYPISRKLIANPLNVAHKTKDNQWIQISMPRYDFHYPIFMKALGKNELAEDSRFYPQTNLQEHLEEFYHILDDAIRSYTLDELVKIMNEADLPYAVCQTWNQVLEDPQAWGSDALAKVTFPNGKERTMVRTPVMFAETGLPAYERGGFLGENTEEVLAKLGYSKEQITAMIAAGEATGCKRIG
ncbi:CaiB/BaiF CoA transferase family protein [Konateibacter massiliensis]|uniref:CaiB/BaiF CoA transferase family protein n=1 Tax=Konateibacter massiliensis TaxID=2002841 RepID=UPI000C152B1C|nr:CaiB/BaiF CoA-transferase family protein [Konateibacter massiliensis]